MPDNEENKTVDIDTSGPGAEIELEDNSKENENELEVKNENEENNDSSEKSNEQSDIQTSEQKESKEDELKEYSESVQKRIAKLTKKWREAERQKDEALTYAQRIMEDKKRADEKLSKLEPGFLKSTEDSIVSGLAAAKSDLAKAREAGDIEAEVDAQTRISELAYKQARFLETKTQQEEFNKAKEAEVKQTEVNLNRQQVSRGNPDPKAEDWASKNTWFGQDAAMTYTALIFIKSLLRKKVMILIILVSSSLYHPVYARQFSSGISRRVKVHLKTTVSPNFFMSCFFSCLARTRGLIYCIVFHMPIPPS